MKVASLLAVVDVGAVDYSRVMGLCREDISFMTGVRTGCKVECIQPILRLLEAAGITPEPPKGGWQWYGRTVTAWETPEEVKRKYASQGFYFDEDIKLLDSTVVASAMLAIS